MTSKLCYLSTGIMDTAFDSQVLPVLLAARESHFDLIHISLDPFRQKKSEKYLEKKDKLDSKGVRTLYFKQMPPFAKSSLTIDAQRIFSAFRAWEGGKEEGVIHSRGHLNAYRGLILKKKYSSRIRLIADLRGAISDEACQGRASLGRNLFTQYLRKVYQNIEYQVVQRADAILCVSNVFKEYLQTKYRPVCLMMIPTFVDTSLFNFSKSLREFYRKKLGISDRIVLVYSGGTAPWQKIEYVVKLFTRLRKEMNNLFVLFLSSDPFSIQNMIRNEIQQKDFQVLRVPHSEVGGYLCAADVGVLLRESSLTNHVAAPIKFSEYMCCGLPCILSQGIGDTAEVIRKGNAGVALAAPDDSLDLFEFQKLLSLNREEISKMMIQRYSSEIYLPQMLDLYRMLGESSKGLY